MARFVLSAVGRDDGHVAFDADRATQVLAPISGPVSRLLVSVGAQVKAGEPLATVASPDFAAAVSAYRKAEAAARNTRRIADLDQELFKNDAIARRDLEQAETDAVSAEADRDAALQQLRSLGLDEGALDDIRQGRAVAAAGGAIRSPIDGTVVEKLITPGPAAAGRHHALLHRGRPVHGLGDGQHLRVEPSLRRRGRCGGDHDGRVARGLSRERSTTSRPSWIPNTRAISVRIVAAQPEAAAQEGPVRERLHPFEERQHRASRPRLRRAARRREPAVRLRAERRRHASPADG